MKPIFNSNNKKFTLKSEQFYYLGGQPVTFKRKTKAILWKNIEALSYVHRDFGFENALNSITC